MVGRPHIRPVDFGEGKKQPNLFPYCESKDDSFVVQPVAKSTRLAYLVSSEPFKYVLNMNTNFN